MGKHRKVIEKSRGAGVKGNLSREELFLRTDTYREMLFKRITEHGPIKVREISALLKVPNDSARTYGEYLVKCGAAFKTKIGLDTIFTATGHPYIPAKRKTFGGKSEPDCIGVGRVIRLLDRLPEQVSKEEHRLARRNRPMSMGMSSMAMFDGH